MTDSNIVLLKAPTVTAFQALLKRDTRDLPAAAIEAEVSSLTEGDKELTVAGRQLYATAFCLYERYKQAWVRFRSRCCEGFGTRHD